MSVKPRNMSWVSNITQRARFQWSAWTLGDSWSAWMDSFAQEPSSTTLRISTIANEGASSDTKPIKSWLLWGASVFGVLIAVFCIVSVIILCLVLRKKTKHPKNAKPSLPPQIHVNPQPPRHPNAVYLYESRYPKQSGYLPPIETWWIGGIFLLESIWRDVNQSRWLIRVK